jgi:hypothetical protein
MNLHFGESLTLHVKVVGPPPTLFQRVSPFYSADFCPVPTINEVCDGPGRTQIGFKDLDE